MNNRKFNITRPQSEPSEKIETVDALIDDINLEHEGKIRIKLPPHVISEAFLPPPESSESDLTPTPEPDHPSSYDEGYAKFANEQESHERRANQDGQW